jgi:tRNA modification GTPase
MPDTIAAIASGYSLSAIGIIRISGELAVSAAEKLFRPCSGEPVSRMEDRKLVYGELRSDTGELLDLCLCTVSRAPHSYTGEDTAEFQCHGSPVVLRAVLDSLFRLGLRQAKPGEFTRRAFLNGKMELTSAEAVADLIDAETEEAAKNAAGQLSGAISKKTDSIYHKLVDICAHYHAVLDYPDEDIEPFVLGEYHGSLQRAADTLTRLLKTYDRGKMMNAGIPTAIVGRPNAGKSSLLNALLGYDRAIVTDIPGTTRDTIEEKWRLGNVVLKLTDTAGIRDAADEAERLGVERSYAAMDRAALVIVVVDGTTSFTPEDEQLLAYAKKAPAALLVLSKKDLPTFQNIISDAGIPAYALSAETGEGVDRLEEAIAELFPVPDVPAGEILTNARQAEAVTLALDYLHAAITALENGETPDIVLTEAEGAMNAIGELSGRIIREDVTNRIFSRFCVGK